VWLFAKKEETDILVAYSDIGPALIGTYLLAKKHKLPFSLFFYDLYLGNKLPFVFNILARYFEPKLLKNAKHVFVMGDALHDLYQNRYQRNDIKIIYNSTTEPEHKYPYEGSDEYTINYLGSVYWAQIDAIKDLIKALPLVPEKPLLKMFTTHSKEYLNEVGIFETDQISFHSCMPEEVPAVLNKSSVNFIGLSLSTPYPNLINTSSPGRLCEFLRSDAPILIHAPAESFMVKYATRENFAFISTDSNPTELAKVISNALRSESEDKVSNAHRVLASNHNPEINAQDYWRVVTGN